MRALLTHLLQHVRLLPGCFYPTDEGLYVISGLSTGKGLGPFPPASAHIAPFAQAHYYREMALRLNAVRQNLVMELAGTAEKNSAASAIRIFSNSPLPERQLALKAGFGTSGRNGLVFHSEAGSLVVIGGMFIPAAWPQALVPAPQPIAVQLPSVFDCSECGSCSRCVESCPVQAILPGGRIDTARCLQAWATKLEPLPDFVARAWGQRLYGCQVCQEVCPRNARHLPPAECSTGMLGPGIPLKNILSLPEPAAFKPLLAGSALGLRWINPSALIRNALHAAIACTELTPTERRDYIRRWITSPEAPLSKTAQQIL